MLPLRLVIVLTGLVSAVKAVSFSGSDNFNYSAPFDPVRWNTGNANGVLVIANNRAQFVNQNGMYNMDGFVTWKPANDGTSFSENWTATVTTTLGPTTAGTNPSLGLYVQPMNGNLHGIMLRALGTSADIFAFRKTNANPLGSHLDGSFGTTGLATVSTNDTTDVGLRISWDHATSTLSSAYSFDNSTFTTVSSIASSVLGGTPSGGFQLMLYAQSGGALHDPDQMYFDDFSVSAGSNSVPDGAPTALLVGLGIIWMFGLRSARGRSDR